MAWKIEEGTGSWYDYEITVPVGGHCKEPFGCAQDKFRDEAISKEPLELGILLDN